VGKFFSEISKNAQTLTHKIHVRSALNPILWLTLITTPLCWGFAYLYPAFQSLLIYAGLFPPGVAIIGFFYFMLCDSPKLQSEDYQIKHEALQMMQSKKGATEVDLEAVELIANPSVRQLENE